MVNLKDINVTINSYFFEAEINVPSPVLTSTPQNEELNLSYSPNFQMKVEDTYSYLTVSDTANVSFSYDGKDYTAYCNVINRSGNIVTLQYADDLVVDDTPVVHTLEFNKDEFILNYDNYTRNGFDGHSYSDEINVLYDNEDITSEVINDITGKEHCYTNYNELSQQYRVIAKDNNEVGEYTDTLSITYEGLTTYCTVNVNIADSTPAQSNEYITFTTSQGTFVVWSNSGIETETVTFIDSDIYDTDWYCMGTWKYYIDDVEVVFEEGEDICSSQGNNPAPFRWDGIIIFDTDWQTGEVQTQTGEIGYLHWLEDDTREFTILDDNLSINLQYIAADDSSDDSSDDSGSVLEDYTLNDAPSQYSDIGGVFDAKVTSDESNDVYMTTVGMTYDTDHYLFDVNNQTDYVLRFWAPSDKTIDKITFVGLNEPYATAFVQQGTVGYGTITSDGNGNIIWTRTQDYNTYVGLEEFSFTGAIQTLGVSMTCNEIIISLNPDYIPPEMKITFTTSQGTFQVWNNFTAGVGYGETVMYDLASDVMGNSQEQLIQGTWKYYIDDVEQDSSTHMIQSEVNSQFDVDGLKISSTDNDGNVHSATGDIGYWGAVYYVTLDSNVTINYQMALV